MWPTESSILIDSAKQTANLLTPKKISSSNKFMKKLNLGESVILSQSKKNDVSQLDEKTKSIESRSPSTFKRWSLKEADT